MVKHVIIWSFKEEMSADEKRNAAKKIKTELEDLINKIDGLVEISVVTEPLPSSKGDLLLDSLFVDNDALLAYQENPDHLKVAQYVRSVVSERKCIDYEI